MLELLYTTLVLFGFLLPGFFIFKEFKPRKIFLHFFLFILSIILLSNNFYKKHTLYKEARFQYIQKTDFNPIRSLFKDYYENGTFKDFSFDTLGNSEFSLIKTEKYTIKCLEDYYINKNESCPITDIKLGNKNDKIYKDYIQINENEYIFYTNENQLGKLYKSFSYYDFKKNKEDSFSIDEIKRKENNKLSNPIFDFKSYIKFCDVLCFLLIFLSLWCTIFETLEDYDIFKIYSFLLRIILIILQFIRFDKFIEMKKFFFDNKDIYDTNDKNYFPNEIFNIDGFPLAVLINIFIYNFLFFLIPDKISCCESPECCECDFSGFSVRKYKINREKPLFFGLLFFLPLYIAYFTLAVLDILNDNKIKDSYNKLIYNWNMSPISSISITNEYDDSNYRIRWKNDYFKFEKLNKFNYINIYSNKNGKICGKDNYGNNLYFPENEKCPINNIFVSEKNENLKGYTKLELHNGEFLYYTNEYIEGKIVIYFMINSDTNIPLNPEYEDYFPNIPFYEEIDSNYNEGENMHLYSLNYLGINTTSISGDKITKFKHNINLYKSIAKGKLALFCLQNIFIALLILFYILFEYRESNNGCLGLILMICLVCYIAIFFLYITFVIICLTIHVKDITNFMNRINLDFERERNDFKWNLIILIFKIQFIVAFIMIIIFDCKEPFPRSYNDDNSTKNKLKELDQTISDKNEEISKLKKENETLKTEIKEKDIRINTLNLNNNSEIKKPKLIPQEEMTCVYFQSQDQRINYPITCLNSNVFAEIEEKLYLEYPDYRKTNNYFLFEGNQILRFKTIKENNIVNGKPVTLVVPSNDD